MDSVNHERFILGIAPWNAPIVLAVHAIAVPLACGNAVILEASETCPRTHALVFEAFVEAGFPDGVVNLVTNAPADTKDNSSLLLWRYCSSVFNGHQAQSSRSRLSLTDERG